MQRRRIGYTATPTSLHHANKRLVSNMIDHNTNILSAIAKTKGKRRKKKKKKTVE